MAGKEYGPVPIASGVLVKGVSKFYLVTCKHVFANISAEDVIILTRFGLAVRLPEKLVFVNEGGDSVDLAVILISGLRLDELKSRYGFLPKRFIGISHVFDEELYYLMFGFPNKKTSREDIAFHADSFGYLSSIRHFKKFEKLGFNYENNITLEYSRKQSGLLDEELQFGFRDLEGLSGGGVWLSAPGRKKDTYKYILVGIMIEERVDRGFVIGTKISLLAPYLL